MHDGVRLRSRKRLLFSCSNSCLLTPNFFRFDRPTLQVRCDFLLTASPVRIRLAQRRRAVDAVYTAGRRIGRVPTDRGRAVHGAAGRGGAAVRHRVIAAGAARCRRPAAPIDGIRADLTALIGNVQPRLVHSNSLAMGRLAGPVTAALGVPGVAHLRDIVGLSRQAVADLNCHVRLLAVSHATREFHVAQGLVAAKTHVLYNGVDLETFHPQPARGFCIANWGCRRGRRCWAPSGRSGSARDTTCCGGPWSGWRTRRVHWIVVGRRLSDKDESREFEARLLAANRQELPGRIHCLGLRDDVAEILPELTLLVHPARQEPLGRVLLEAAACGVPIVASDVGGTREIFAAEEKGDSPRLCEAPFGPFRQMGTVPFFP